MVGPVSVMRMGMLMLKRQVESDSIDSQACSERVALIDSQIGQLIDGVRLLRNWELATTDEGITRPALVRLCVELLRPAFSLQGVHLEIAAALGVAPDSDGDEPRWPRAAALRYLLLCGLNYLHDASPASATIHVEPEGEDGLLLRMTATPSNGDANAPLEGAALHRAPRSLAIDAVALQSLADDLGYEIEVDGESNVRMRLGPA